MRLEGRVAIVTGGAGTIGSAIVRRLAREGAIAVVADRRADAAEAVAAEVEGARGGGARRHRLAGVGRARRRPRGRARPHRHPRQQRGHPRAGAGRGHDRRGLGPRHPHQRLLRLLRLPRRGAGDAPGRARARSSTSSPASSASPTRAPTRRRSSSCTACRSASCWRSRATASASTASRPAPSPTPGFERWYREKAALLGIPYDEFLAGALDSVPLHRFGRGEDIAEGVLYLASDEADYVTGHLLEVDGGFAGYAFALRPEEG